MKTKKLEEKIEIPKEVQVEIDGYIVKMKGPKGEITKNFLNPRINLSKQESKIILSSSNSTKKEKKILNSIKAHIQNLIYGVLNSYTYKLKVCSTHFPISISTDNNRMIIKNFLGEKTPRKAQIIKNVGVKVAGDIITIEGLDKEAAGQTAANIEQATRVTNRDRRVFSDGCYIIMKANKELGKK